MRNRLLSISCAVAIVFLSIQLRAQQPQQPEHEKRVYVNEGNTYVQKGLPLYLKFSTSPGGQNYDLNSKATSKYASPMYLDTEGINYIRSRWAVDPETKKTVQPQQEVLYEVYADGLPPYTYHKFMGAPKYTSNKVYFGKGLSFSLTSKDGVSGVEKVHVALNSNSWSDYSSDMSVDSEGDYNLYYYAHDNVGNAEKVRSTSFTVDLTAPTSNHSIVGIVYNGNILAPSTQFSLSKSDALSGVRVTKYSFDGGSDRTHGGNISMAGLADGDHLLYYYSTDNVKNVEEKKQFAFYLDRIPPVVENQVNGDQYKGKYLYVSPRTNVTFSATDNKAGVNKIYYRIDGKERYDYASAVSIPNVKGVHTFKYDATDNVQNLSPNKYLTVYMDNVAPTTGIKYGRPQFFARDTLFINKDTKISLFATDYESGVQKISYQVDGSSYKEYSQFTIPGDGYHTINFKTTDRVNNEEQEKTSNVFVDNVAPTIYHNFSIEPIGDKKGLKVYPNYTRLYLGATDDHVGTESIEYSINGGAWTLYSSATTLDVSERNRFLKKKIKYEVKVRTKDKLGNASEQTIEFYVGLQSDPE
jgi:hypothetical protein